MSSQGLPVLINYPGWLANLIKSEKCGIFIPPENIEQFARELISISHDKSSLNSMSQNSKKLALKQI